MLTIISPTPLRGFLGLHCNPHRLFQGTLVGVGRNLSNETNLKLSCVCSIRKSLLEFDHCYGLRARNSRYGFLGVWLCVWLLLSTALLNDASGQNPLHCLGSKPIESPKKDSKNSRWFHARSSPDFFSYEYLKKKKKSFAHPFPQMFFSKEHWPWYTWWRCTPRANCPLGR